MKTTDTTKPWHAHTNAIGIPEIAGPHGVRLHVYGATAERAQEIANTLNGESAPYSVTFRVGAVEATYSANDPSEVMWMAAQGEKMTSAAPTINVSVQTEQQEKKQEQTMKDLRMTAADAEISRLLRMNEALKANLADAEKAVGIFAWDLDKWKATVVRVSSESDAWHAQARTNAKEADAALDENDVLKKDAIKAQEKIDTLTRERDETDKTAANLLGIAERYQEQLDRCGYALGHEAFVSDDGSVQDKPLRGKIAEMVEKLCRDQEQQRNEVIEECAQFLEQGNFLHGDLRVITQAMRNTLKVMTSFASSDRTYDFQVSDVKPGPCAKQTVTATIISPAGVRFTGTNECETPQRKCPRAGMETGVGYELCREVCKQTGHAELNALRKAGPAAQGGVMYVEGHTYVCLDCHLAVLNAGIRFIVMGAPPAPGEKE